MNETPSDEIKVATDGIKAAMRQAADSAARMIEDLDRTTRAFVDANRLHELTAGESHMTFLQFGLVYIEFAKNVQAACEQHLAALQAISGPAWLRGLLDGLPKSDQAR